MASDSVGTLGTGSRDLCWSTDYIRPIGHCKRAGRGRRWLACHAIEPPIVGIVASIDHRWSSSSNNALVWVSTEHWMRQTMGRVRPAFAVDCSRPVHRSIDISSVIVDIEPYRPFDAYRATWSLGYQLRMCLVVSTECSSSPCSGQTHAIDRRIGHDDGSLATAIE